MVVGLLLGAVPGYYLGCLLQQKGGADIRGAWWAVPLGIVIGATAMGPGITSWFKNLSR